MRIAVAPLLKGHGWSTVPRGPWAIGGDLRECRGSSTCGVTWRRKLARVASGVVLRRARLFSFVIFYVFRGFRSSLVM